MKEWMGEAGAQREKERGREEKKILSEKGNWRSRRFLRDFYWVIN